MANIQQADKRDRQAKKRRGRNAALKTKYRTFHKRAIAAVDSGAETASATVAEFFQIADRISVKGVVPQNRTARLKSRLATRLKKAGKPQAIKPAAKKAASPAKTAS